MEGTESMNTFELVYTIEHEVVEVQVLEGFTFKQALDTLVYEGGSENVITMIDPVTDLWLAVVSEGVLTINNK